MTTSIFDRLKLGRILVYGLLLFWCFIVYFPLYWMVITSFKLPVAISEISYLPWIDFQPDLHAWRDLLSGSSRETVLRHFYNGMILSVGSAIAAVLIGSMAGYGLARFQYRFGSWRNNEIAFWFISQRIMPPIATVLAFLLMYRYLGLVDSLLGLWLAYTAFNIPLAVWLLRDFFKEIPIDLEESAQIDGASRLRLFWSISLPLAVPGLVATFILCFIFTWNEFLFVLILSYQNAGTVPLLLASQMTSTGVQWWSMSALAVMSIVPSVLCALVLERYIASGIFAGSIK